MYEAEIEAKIQCLPEAMKEEVLDYVVFLLSKYRRNKTKTERFKFDWEGGLLEMKEKLSSVELQHKALEWR